MRFQKEEYYMNGMNFNSKPNHQQKQNFNLMCILRMKQLKWIIKFRLNEKNFLLKKEEFFYWNKE